MQSINKLFSKVFKSTVLAIFGLAMVASLAPATKVGAQMVSGSIVATPDTITAGQSTEIRWNSFDANSISITPGIGNVAPSGSVRVSPTQTTTYTLHIRNTVSGSSTDGTATVYVNPVQDQTCKDQNATNYGGPLPCKYDGQKPTVNIEADDTRIDEGDETTVRWSSQRADTCTATEGRNGWAGSKSKSGSFDTDDLTRNTTYRITCTNEHGSATDSVTVRVEEDEEDDDDRTCENRSALNYRGSLPCRFAPVVTAQPLVDIYADSTEVAFNGSTTIRWNTVNASSCFASGGSTGWAGPRSIGPASFFTGPLTGTRTYIISCNGASDSVTVNVRPRTVVTTTTRTTATPRPAASSLVIVNSSIDRNQPILPTLDNTQPRVGDEINYTVTYQNIGTGAITNLVLRLDLPFEVDYMFSTPNNPVRSGNTLIFNLGTLRANGEGTVTVRVRVREDAAPGALLNFPAVLSYTDPAGFPQSVAANVSAQVWRGPAEAPIFEDTRTVVPLGASIFGAGFWPTSLFGWMLFLILILVLVALVRSLFSGNGSPFTRKTVTTVHQ